MSKEYSSLLIVKFVSSFRNTQLFEVNVHYSQAEDSVRIAGIGNFQSTKISSKHIYAT